jgi:nucleoside-diphosphate-sugar epimerase
MRALVTGATGFVGSHLTEALRRQGDEVTALARSARKAEALAPLGVRVVAGDLHDLTALTRAVEGQDVIYHVAGIVAAASEGDFFTANRDGTANLVAAAERVGQPRFVLVSSMAAVGPSAKGQPRRGDEPVQPVTAYGRSKLAGERVVTASALPWCIVRPPMVYGPRDTEVLKVFRLARLGIAPVFGDGSQELCAVHGADLADALVAVGRCANTARRSYFACHPETFTSADFVRTIAAVMGRRLAVVRIPPLVGRVLLRITETGARLSGQTTILTTDKANEFFQPAWVASPAELTRDTGWCAARDLRTGLAETHQWYRSAGWL